MDIINLIEKHKLVIRKLNKGYVCQPVKHNDTIVRFDKKTDNYSDTLEGSIKLFLNKIKGVQ